MLWVACIFLPAFVWKLLEWVWYTFFSRNGKPVEAPAAEVEAKKCPATGAIETETTKCPGSEAKKTPDAGSELVEESTTTTSSS